MLVDGDDAERHGGHDAVQKRIASLDLGRQALGPGHPENQAPGENQEAPEEADELLQEGLHPGVANDDEAVQSLEVVGDVDKASEQQEPEPGDDEVPAFAVCLESSPADPPQKEHDPKQNERTDGFESDVYHGIRRFCLDLHSRDGLVRHCTVVKNC
ncbi:MAG: hypothetical protein V3R90_08795 [Limibaculum sp.]